jgi:hypothetical protein
MALVDGPQKLSFLLTQALAAQALANAIPDPLGKRLAARGVFVAVDGFVELARQTRNGIPRSANTKGDLDATKDALNALADRDWGPYSPLRDRIGAHRQPIGGEDNVRGWAGANELWAQVDAPLVGVLCDDMAEIYAGVQRLMKTSAFAAPVLPTETADKISAAPHFQARAGLRVATGSFGETIMNTLTPVQGGAIGERLRQISDTIDGFECYATLIGFVGGLVAFERAVVAGAVIEAANMVELVFDVPSGRTAANRYPPLVDLIPSHYAEAADLRSELSRLSAADVTWIRQLRNSIAAHVDVREPLPVLLRRLDTTDRPRVDRLFHQICQALVDVDAKHPITVFSTLVRLRGARMAGLERVAAPEFPSGYDV